MIKEPGYHDVTLKVLSIFEVDRSLVGYAMPLAIQFQLLGEPQRLSYKEFALLKGSMTLIYYYLSVRCTGDRSSTRSHPYDRLGWNYEMGFKNAYFLVLLTHRYLHTMIVN